jgi:hypothetical protein
VDFLAHVTLCQRYRNAEARSITCEYVFPMDSGAAVNRLVSWVRGTLAGLACVPGALMCLCV